MNVILYGDGTIRMLAMILHAVSRTFVPNNEATEMKRSSCDEYIEDPALCVCARAYACILMCMFIQNISMVV